MKRALLLSLAIICMNCFSVLSQDTGSNASEPTSDELKEALQNTLADFDSSKDYAELQNVSNKFGLIAKKWNDKWIAQFYSAYSSAVLSYSEKKDAKRDAYLDEADKYLKDALTLCKEKNDELYVVAAMIANARVAVRSSRYKKYGEIFNAYLDSAKSLNPNNPRIYYLEGTNIYYTPKMFGGGAKNALPFFEKAEALFQNEKGGDAYKPFWGKKQNSDLLKQCQEEIK
jgi:hypothetical protein